MTVRISALPMVRFCAKASEMSVGSGRAAVMSSAFHAMCAQPPEAASLLARLSDEERETVMSWQPPADVKVGSVILKYREAAHEVPVAFTAKGMPCPHGSPEALTEGHLDMAWEVVLNSMSTGAKGGQANSNACKVAYVGDIKKTQWTTLDGPDSLQLVAYGFAWALMNGCDAFACGIWMATEGEWHWGDLVWLDSDRGLELWEQVCAAANNTSGEYATGSHCRGCYSRLRCPAYLVAPGDVQPALELLQRPLTEDDNDALVDLLLKADAAKDAANVVRELAEEYAARFGLRDPKTGKEFRPIQCKGKEGFDAKGLKKDAEIDPALEPALKYFKKGAPYEQWRWLRTGAR